MKNKFFLSFLFLIFFLIIIIMGYVCAENSEQPVIPFSNYFESDFVTSIVFQEATLGEFCEVDANTNECSSTSKEIILGYAVLKYNTSKIFEILSDEKKEVALNDPEQYRDYEQSVPFVIFIIDNDIYIGGIAGGYVPSSESDKISVRLSGKGDVEPFLASVGEDPESGRNWEFSRLILPNGLSVKNNLMFNEMSTTTFIDSSMNEVRDYEPFQNFYLVNFTLSELNEPLPPGSATLHHYDVGEIVLYKNYKLVEVKNSLSNLEINK